MKKENSRPIIIFAGEGGHTEQMSRLAKKLVAQGENVISVGEAVKPSISIVSPYKNKISKLSKIDSCFKYMYIFPIMILTFIWVNYLLIRLRPKGVILLGPMFCVPAIFGAKILRCKAVYIESWSRFYSPSQSARLANRLRIRVLYQNISMKRFFVRGEYCGRL